MKYYFNFFVIVSIAFSIYSCKSTYKFKYHTYLSSPIENEELVYEDSLFKIAFLTAPNGIHFDIYNQTNSTAFLIWDKCYIIYPDGNSYKALNTDILNTDSRLVDKETYESIIPPKSSLRRFTTSAQNINTFRELYSHTSINTAINQISSATIYNEFFTHSPYWKLEHVINYDNREQLIDSEKFMFSNFVNTIKENDKLGLGFTIRLNNEELLYDFRFMIDEVLVFRKTSDDVAFEPYKVLEKAHDFEPFYDSE